MEEVKNSDFAITELMQTIRKEVSKHKEQARSELVKPDIKLWTMKSIISQIDALLNNADNRAKIRTKWPDKLDRFPFNLSGKVQKLALKTLKVLFLDQREVNFSLIQALRESLVLNRQLIAQVEQLQQLATAQDNQIKVLNENLGTLANQVKGMDERAFKNDIYVKNELIQQKRLITLFLEEAWQRLPENFSPDQLKHFVNEDKHLLDAFYVAFEDNFRGSYEDILHRLKVYLPIIEEAKVGTPDAPILDIGCGRGEWLDLLRDVGLTAQGVDLNRVMVEQCQAKGLEVLEKDAIDYLRSRPDASLGAVTGFHIIEHLPFVVLLKLFDEVVRVLKPEGLVIFETPNPQNVIVSSHNFYIDPTHRNPLPSALMKFVAESRGLFNIKIIDLNPYPEQFRMTGSELAEQFNTRFYGSQDYAVIGYKI